MGLRLVWVRKAHTFLGIFFAPLLLLFILTGAWQTLGYTDPDRDDEGKFALLMGKLSRVHTDSYYPSSIPGHHSVFWFQALATILCAALMISIISGLFLAWKSSKKKWPLLLALALGIFTPVILLCLK